MRLRVRVCAHVHVHAYTRVRESVCACVCWQLGGQWCNATKVPLKVRAFSPPSLRAGVITCSGAHDVPSLVAVAARQPVV